MEFAFNSEGWGLGAFGYSSSAGGETPGAEGLFESLNSGKLIGESMIAWGDCWRNLINPLGPYGQGNNYEYYKLNFIGDPLLKA